MSSRSAAAAAPRPAPRPVPPQRLDLKVVLVGDAGVGKTCIVNRFTESTFTHHTASTAGASFRYKVCIHDGCQVTLGLWDTAGQARCDNLQSFYCRGALAAVVCYSVADRASFESVAAWVRRVRREADPGCVIAMVATKSDLAADGRREVTVDEGSAAAAANGALFFETSARSGARVVEVFNALIAAHIEWWQTRRLVSAKSKPSGGRGGGGGVADGSSVPLLAKGGADSDDAANDGGAGCCACAVQ